MVRSHAMNSKYARKPLSQLLERARLGARLADAPRRFARGLFGQRQQHRALVRKVIVKRAGGERGARHDVAHGGGVIADVDEHGARGVEQNDPVARLVLLALAGWFLGHAGAHAGDENDAYVKFLEKMTPAST
jgi:hypothetical protein